MTQIPNLRMAFIEEEEEEEEEEDDDDDDIRSTRRNFSRF